MSKAEAVVWRLGRQALPNEWEWWASELAGNSPYLSRAWLQALSEGIGQDILVHAVQIEKHVGVIAIIRRGGHYGIHIGRKPWATAYNIFSSKGVAGIGLDYGLLGILCRAYRSVRAVSRPGEALPFAPCIPHERCAWPTFLLDIRDTERCWANCDRHVRQRVRKARDLGITVAASDGAEAFEHLYRLTYERQGVALPFPKGAVAHAVTLACRDENIRLYLAHTISGEPVAGLLVGCDSTRAYFMLAGSHPELRKTDAVTLLWWSVIEEVSKRLPEVDMVGIGSPAIQRFKESFCPSRVDCADIRYSHWSARLAGRAGKWLRTIRRPFYRDRMESGGSLGPAARTEQD